MSGASDTITTYRDALREALIDAMSADDDIIVLGEDVVCTVAPMV